MAISIRRRDCVPSLVQTFADRQIRWRAQQQLRPISKFSWLIDKHYRICTLSIPIRLSFPFFWKIMHLARPNLALFFSFLMITFSEWVVHEARFSAQDVWWNYNQVFDLSSLDQRLGRKICSLWISIIKRHRGIMLSCTSVCLQTLGIHESIETIIQLNGTAQWFTNRGSQMPSLFFLGFRWFARTMLIDCVVAACQIRLY